MSDTTRVQPQTTHLHATTTTNSSMQNATDSAAQSTALPNRNCHRIATFPPGKYKGNGNGNGNVVGNHTSDHEEKFPVLSKASSRQVALDAALEEKIMRIVLAHAPRLMDGRMAKRDVWENIARASPGRYKSGVSARIRTAWLCKVLQATDHVAHAEITPKLREMLLQFLRPEDPAKGKDTSAQQTHRHNTNRKVQVETDESLMKIVLEKRPFAENRFHRPRVWAEIIHTLQNHPTIKSRVAVQGRVRFLVSVFANATHPEHAKLTPMLRRLLTEYLRVSGDQEATQPSRKPQVPVMIEEVSENQDAALSDSSGFTSLGYEDDGDDSLRPLPLTVNEVLQSPEVGQNKRKHDQTADVIQCDQKRAKVRRTEQLHFRPEPAEPLTSVTAPVTSPLDAMASRLVVQVTKLEYEQREVRAELRTLVQMLQDERAQHHRETALMLDMLQKEREDRVALMALVTRSA